MEELHRLSHHTESCRQVCFNEEGDLLYTISSDKSLAILDINNGGISVKEHRTNIHDSPICSFYELNNNVYATGDDEGIVKLWDARIAKGVKSFDCSSVGKDAVSSLLSSSRLDYLSATCMDGSLTGINLKKLKIEAQVSTFCIFIF